MPKFLIKLLISIAILTALYLATDFLALGNSFRNLSLVPLLYAFGFVLCIRFFMALRWKILLLYYNVQASLLKLIEIIFVSNSLGHLLPSGIGTDIVRTYELARSKGSSEQILASVFLDRVFGLVSMLFVAIVSAWLAFFLELFPLTIPVLFTLVIAALPAGYYLLRLVVPRNLNHTYENKWIKKIFAFYNRFVEALTTTKLPRHGLFILFFLSISVQLTRSIVFMFIFLSAGAGINPVFYFIFVPIVFIIMLVPVSIGGLGVRESALFAFFGPLGISLSDCVVSGLVFHAIQLVLLLPGVILFTVRREPK